MLEILVVVLFLLALFAAMIVLVGEALVRRLTF